MKIYTITKGYTLIEILVVIAISVAIISAVGATFFNLIKVQALDKDYVSIISLIDQARSQTINSLSGLQYGVFFSSSTVALFKGPTYSSSSISQQYDLNGRVNISMINLVGSSTNQIIFDRLTGYANASGTVTVSLKDGSVAAKNVQIYRTGTIEYK